MRQPMRWLRILVALLLALLASCGDDENPAGNDDGNGDSGGTTGGIVTNHTDPVALIAAHAKAASARNLEAYKALLQQPAPGVAGFRFYPKSSDANDLPWLDDDYWDYDTETTIMSHMFDSTYSSPESEAVQSLSMEFRVLSMDDQGDGTYVGDCTSSILVLVGPNDGFFSDTRFIFNVVTVGSHLRIQSIEEIERQKGALSDRATAKESTSWGAVKSLYR